MPSFSKQARNINRYARSSGSKSGGFKQPPGGSNSRSSGGARNISQSRTVRSAGKSAPSTPGGATGSAKPVPGWKFSSFDNAYHPPSWFSPTPDGGTTKSKNAGQSTRLTTPTARGTSLKSYNPAAKVQALTNKAKVAQVVNAVTNAARNANTAARTPSSRTSPQIAPRRTAPTPAPPIPTGGGTRPAVRAPVTAAPSTPSRPAPPIVNPGVGGINAGTFTNSGVRGTRGQFQRQRRQRGPRGGTSLTPEMLRRLAMTRIGSR